MIGENYSALCNFCYDIDGEAAIKHKQNAEQNEANYTKEISEYETWLGNPNWEGKPEVAEAKEGRGVFLKRIKGSNKYTDYSITPGGYLHAFQQIGYNEINNVYSEQPAPAHVIVAAEKLKSQHEAEEEDLQE